MSLILPAAIREEIIDQARREAPNECCGLLAGPPGQAIHRYPITNADASPVHFTLEPEEQLAAMLDLEQRGWDLTAVYHSHTHTRAYPSETDVRMAQISLAFYPDTLFLILSLARPEQPDLRAFRIRGEQIDEVEIRLDRHAIQD